MSCYLPKPTAFTLAVLALPLASTSCERSGENENGEITARDVLLAQRISAFLIRLPQDLRENQEVVVEAYNESGTVATAVIGRDLQPGSLLKLFIDRSSTSNQLSFVAGSRSGTGQSLDLGEATLQMSLGESGKTELPTDRPFAVFSIDANAASQPEGDDIALRVVIRD